MDNIRLENIREEHGDETALWVEFAEDKLNINFSDEEIKSVDIQELCKAKIQKQDEDAFTVEEWKEEITHHLNKWENDTEDGSKLERALLAVFEEYVTDYEEYAVCFGSWHDPQDEHEWFRTNHMENYITALEQLGYKYFPARVDGSYWGLLEA